MLYIYKYLYDQIDFSNHVDKFFDVNPSKFVVGCGNDIIDFRFKQTFGKFPIHIFNNKKYLIVIEDGTNMVEVSSCDLSNLNSEEEEDFRLKCSLYL